MPDGVGCQKQPYDESSEQKVEVRLLRCHRLSAYPQWELVGIQICKLQIQVTIDPRCPDVAGLRPSAVSRYPKVITELIGRRDTSSAAAFYSPEICRISLVNCETKSKWQVSRVEYLSGSKCGR